MLSFQIKNLIEQLYCLQNNKNIYQYCEQSLYLFDKSKSLLDLSAFENYLSSKQDLFPIVSTMYQNIHIGNWYLIINFIYHFNDLKNKQDLENKNELIVDLLNLKNQNLIWEEVNFSVEKLLSTNSEDRLITFLFIYFLPIYKDNRFDLDYKDNEPYLTKLAITNENFDVLLYLWTFNQENNKNNSLLLMFIKNFIYSNNINKENLLTKHKMEKFFKLGLSIIDVENSLNKKELSGCEKVLLNLKNQEKEFLFKQLSLDLEKNDNKKKDKTKL